MECKIWLTVDHDNPDFEDIAKIKCTLENIIGSHYEGEIGIGFTPIQWGNFLRNLSRFEQRMSTMWPRTVMGFPVRLIAPLKEEP